MQSSNGFQTSRWRTRLHDPSQPATKRCNIDGRRSSQYRIKRLSIACSATAAVAAASTAVLEELRPTARPSAQCLEVGFGPNGRGLFAKQAIQSGVDALTVPLAYTLMVVADDSLQETISPLIFDTASQPDDPERPAIAELYPGAQYLEEWQRLHGSLPQPLVVFLRSAQHDNVAKLATWLLWLFKGGAANSSYWQEFCAQLPKPHELTNLAAFSEQERPHLQLGSYISAAEAAAAVAEEFHRLYYGPEADQPLLKALGLAASFEEVLWAYSMVSSRTFGAGPYRLLVPFADMGNHHLQENVMWRLNPLNKRTYTLITTRRIGRSEELIISYGAGRNNAYLLSAYGFVLPGNPYDRLTDLPGTPTSVSNISSPACREFLAAQSELSSSGSSSSSSGGGSSGSSGSSSSGSSIYSSGCSSNGSSGSGSSYVARPLQLNTAALMVCSGFTLRDEGQHHGIQPAGPAAQQFLFATDESSVTWRRKLAALLSLPLRMEQLQIGHWRRAIKQRHALRTLVGTDADVAAERAAAEQLLGACDAMLAALPTTAEEDQGVLDGAAAGECVLSSRQWMATFARLEHKRLVQQAMGLLQGYITALSAL